MSFVVVVTMFVCLAFGNLQKRRDRTSQRLGDGAEQFGFAFLDPAVRIDNMHAGFD